MTDLGFPVGTNEHGLSAGLATVQAVYPETSWQVVTNIPVYNIPLEQLMNSCWRFNTLYTILENNSGSLSWEEGIDALEVTDGRESKGEILH